MAPSLMIHTLFVIISVVASSSAFVVLHCATTTTVTNAFLVKTTTTSIITLPSIKSKSMPPLSLYSRPTVNMRRNRRRPNEIHTLSSTLDTGNTIDTENNNSNDDNDDTVVVTWLDNINENEEDDTEKEASQQTPTKPTSTTTKTTWGSKLSPKVKERIILAGQQRAINNKQKRISDMDRKRRQLMFVKDRQREKKQNSKINRPIPLAASSTEIERIPLEAYITGMKCYGTCISLTNFGAYIDIGTECDGLLHVTQMINGSMTKNSKSSVPSTFIHHPKQIVQPGDEILVTIRSINPTRKKLHLTLLPWDIVQEQLAIEFETKALKRANARASDSDDEEDDVGDDTIGSLTVSYTDRIPLSDIQVDDELWGEIKRVTDFGAYVEVGAIVDGFLHYMDHPSFTYEYNNNHQQPIHPTSIMQHGDRVRVWVSDIDTIRNRIKLTAHRPSHLPGPRREM